MFENVSKYAIFLEASLTQQEAIAEFVLVGRINA